MKKWIFILLFSIIMVSIHAKTLTIKTYKIYIYDAETKEPLKNVRVVSAIEIKNWINVLVDSISNHKYYLEEYYTDEAGCIELPLRKYHRIALGHKGICEYLYINLQLKEKEDVGSDFHGYWNFFIYWERDNRDEERNGKLYRPLQEYEAWSIAFLPSSEYAEKYIEQMNVTGGTEEHRLYPEDGNLIIYLDKIQNKPPVPQDGIDLKPGKHKLYSYDNGEEVGDALLTKEGNSYNLSFKSKTYREHKAPYNDYNDVEIENVEMQETSIKDSIRNKKVLLGDYKGCKIIITKELLNSFMPKSIYKDYREYYYLIIVPQEVFDKDFIRPYDLVFEIKCSQALYKATFFEDIDK